MVLHLSHTNAPNAPIVNNINSKLCHSQVCTTQSTYSPPTLIGAGHQRTVSTSKGCNQWFSLAKILLKVALAGGNRSLVARTSKCGWAISPLEDVEILRGDGFEKPTNVSVTSS